MRSAWPFAVIRLDTVVASESGNGAAVTKSAKLKRAVKSDNDFIAGVWTSLYRKTLLFLEMEDSVVGFAGRVKYNILHWNGSECPPDERFAQDVHDIAPPPQPVLYKKWRNGEWADAATFRKGVSDRMKGKPIPTRGEKSNLSGLWLRLRQ